MAQTVYRCPAAMPIETLSAWHDRQLDSAEAERVRAHIHTCPACQNYLTDYATETRGVSQFDAPYLQDRIWHGLQQEIGQAKQRRVAPSRGVILGGLGAALAVVVLFATIAVFALDNHGHSLTVVPTGTPAATNTLVPTATVPTLKVSPSQGWITASALASYGKWVIFAQSDPYTGYACGNGASVSQLQPLLFGTTHDGGLTWSTPVTTSVKGVSCSMSINPSNAQDLIMTANSCYFCDTPIAGMYRSLDGGHSWTQLKLPAGNSFPNDQVGLPVWIGSTLFVVATTYISYGGPQQFPAHLIAVSHNGGALNWLSDSALLNLFSKTTTDHVQPIQAFALGNTYFIQISGDACNPGCPLEKTSNEGVTWTPLTSPLSSLNPTIFAGLDGKTLYTSNGTTKLLKSVDGGNTWQNMPALPAGYSLVDAFHSIWSSPDGTVFTKLSLTNSNDGASRLYKLLNTSSNWSFVDTFYQPSNNINTFINSFVTTISSDNSGLPIAIWRYQETTGKGAETLASIAISYHAP